MLRNILVITICLAFIATLACSSGSTDPAAGNSNSQTNRPPEFSGNKITPGGTPTPGIPDPNKTDANKVPKGTTPTPGIPPPEEAGKPLPKGATPTPGIPSPEELKKMANTPRSIEEVNNPKGAANKKGGSTNPRKDKKPPSKQ